MIDGIQNKRNKGIRQKLLAVLRQCFGNYGHGWMPEDLLFSILSPYVKDLTGRDVHEAAVYCELQGYAEQIEVPHDKRVFAAPEAINWRITSKGVNLVDGNIDPDPGIEDNRA